MKNTNLFKIILMLIWPALLPAAGQDMEARQAGSNVNERYVVESIAVTGIDKSGIGESWHEEAQKLVGKKYSEKAARDLAQKLRKELRWRYKVDVRVEKGEKPDHVQVVFHAEKTRAHYFDASIPLLVYHSKQGFSGTLEIPIEIRHNVFTFGILSDADQLLERNAGIRLRYEHRRLGTDRLRLRMDLDSYHQSYDPATRAALAERPDVPDLYRARQNFAPSLSLYPMRELMLSAGVSFQRLQMQYPTLHTETAYAGTAEIQYQRDVESPGGYLQHFGAGYGLRTATGVLDSDYVYTRHRISADYELSRGRHLLGVHFLGGYISGNAPLFERFSLGNSSTLRGWNKFDVAPLGGNRVAHGSLEYRYRYFQIFYDAGAVWDAGRSSEVRHGLGFGFAGKSAFISLAFPVRLNDVAPVFMLGIRY